MAVLAIMRRSLCPCGADAVNEHVPMGTRFTVCLDRLQRELWMCPYCGRVISSVMAWVDDGVNPPGYMPLDLFGWVLP